MLLDIGWNVYNWNNADGNWGDGISNVSSCRLAERPGHDLGRERQRRIQLRSRIPIPAPILPVYGQVTSNIILNFGGSGASQYTSTNDLAHSASRD